MRVVHIEPKQRRAEHDAETLEAALAEHVGKDLTTADASVVSGLPLDATEAALIALAGRFPSRIRVSDDGVLIFRFESLTREHGPSRLQRALATVRRRVLEPLVAGFTVLLAPFLFLSLTRDIVALGSVSMEGGWFFLTVLPCMLIGAFAALGAVLTFLAFILMPVSGLALIAAAVALLVEFLPAPEGFGVKLVMFVFTAATLYFGIRIMRWSVAAWMETVVRKPTWAKRGWKYAVALMLGPKRKAPDRLADERRLTALIRRDKGILTISELVGLFRWTPEQADAQIARILCDYGGDVIVTDDGAILYSFTDRHGVSGAGAQTGSLLMSAGAVDSEVEPVEPEPERFFVAKSKAEPILLLVILGLGALGVLLHPALPLFPASGLELVPVMPDLETDSGPVRLFGFGLWPYALLFGALSLRSLFFFARRLHARRRRRLWRYLAVAAESPEGRSFSRPDLRLVAELGGDYDGTTLSFPELARAKAAAARLREQQEPRMSPGAVADELLVPPDPEVT